VLDNSAASDDEDTVLVVLPNGRQRRSAMYTATIEARDFTVA
jgi:hypothetical protein